MWSVNDLWKKNPVDAFRRLRALGYAGVQSFGFYATVSASTPDPPAPDNLPDFP